MCQRNSTRQNENIHRTASTNVPDDVKEARLRCWASFLIEYQICLENPNFFAITRRFLARIIGRMRVYQLIMSLETYRNHRSSWKTMFLQSCPASSRLWSYGNGFQLTDTFKNVIEQRSRYHHLCHKRQTKIGSRKRHKPFSTLFTFFARFPGLNLSYTTMPYYNDRDRIQHCKYESDKQAEPPDD